MRSPLSHPCSRASAAFALLALAALAATSLGTALGASSSTVVTAQIPSAIQLTNGCVGAAATQFGVVQPGGGGATTAGGACTVSWGSSNDSSMLRIAQRDGVGSAMSRPTSFAGPIQWNLYKGVSSADGTNLLAVGNGGAFSYSTNGGASWTTTSSLGGNGLEIVHVVQQPGTPTVAWVVGYGQRLQRVTSALTAPSATDRMPNLVASGWSPTSSPLAVVMIDADSLIVAGENGWFARSDDDGVNWSSFQMGATGNVYSLQLASTGQVWAATRNNAAGNIWRAPSTGGGVAGDWTQFNAAGSSSLNQVLVTGPSNGYAVGQNGGMWRWDGIAWSWIGTGALEPDDIYSVTSPPGSPATATAYGDDGSIIRTTDGGVTWSRVSSPVGVNLRGSIAGAGWTIAVGNARTTISSADGGASWSFVSDTASARNRIEVAMEPVDGRILLAVGSRGTIWRSTDSGATWSNPTSGTTEPLMDVAFASRTRAWIVGGGGTLLRSDDAGATWTSVASGTSRLLASVTAPDEQTLAAAGDDGTIVRSSNGGTSTTVTSIDPGRELKSISMVDSQVGVVVGYQFVRRTADGGATWTTPTSTPAAMPLEDALMVTPSLGFIAPSWSEVWRTTDGGDTWISTSGTTGDNYNLAAVNEDVIYLGGTELYVSSDGGDSWSQQASPSPIMRGLAAGDGNYVVAGADVGTVQVRAADTTAGVAVPDYGAAPNSWTPSAQGMFGVCVQSIGAQTAIAAPWLVDGDTCTASDADPWRGIPASPTTLATVGVAGDSGSVELVWGVRFAPDQPPGTYTAGVVFEALAPMA